MQRLTESIMQIAVQHSSKFDKKTRIAAFWDWQTRKPAAAQTFLVPSLFLPSMPLTAHSSRTGISFRQLALHVAPVACQGAEFFPLFNGMSFPFPERGR